MAGTLIVSNLKTDTDNTFIVRSNTGTTLFSANTTGIDVANSIGATAITSDKILSIANTKISGNIISSQITSVANTQITGNIVSSQITSIGGSQITANTIANSAIQTGAVENYMNAAGLGFGMRNRIINGAMVIDQRNAGASVTPADGAYTLDRWFVYQFVASKFSVQQNAGSITPPVGFSKYLGVTSLSAYTVLSGGANTVAQSIEGFNTSDLQWGTANAKTVTLSFQVYSSLTGTFGGSVQNSAANRSYPFTYTISSANTWTSISVTIAGDTSGTWIGSTNGKGMTIFFGLGVGSTFSGTAGSWAGAQYYSATGATSVVGTNGATFYITGVQLEKGSTATSFDYRPYGTELVLCQRYYETSRGTASTFTQGTTIAYPVFVSDTNRTSGRQFSVAKRSAPTVTIYSRNNTSGKVSTVSSGADNAGTASTSGISETGWSNTVIGTATTAGVGIEVAYVADSEL